MRLHHVLPEYQERVRLRIRPFPLEVMGGEAAPRNILEQEWWLAALQEPLAEFKPFDGDDWPTTTLPAFEASWCAAQQSESALLDAGGWQQTACADRVSPHARRAGYWSNAAPLSWR